MHCRAGWPARSRPSRVRDREFRRPDACAPISGRAFALTPTVSWSTGARSIRISRLRFPWRYVMKGLRVRDDWSGDGAVVVRACAERGTGAQLEVGRRATSGARGRSHLGAAGRFLKTSSAECSSACRSRLPMWVADASGMSPQTKRAVPRSKLVARGIYLEGRGPWVPDPRAARDDRIRSRSNR